MLTPLGEMPVVDAHAHVFPDRLFGAIWRYFEENYWHVEYKYNGDQVAGFFDVVGVEHFTTLNYAHRPNISAEMNAFTRDFCDRHPNAIPIGTVHPGDDDLSGVAETALTSYDLEGFKFQLLVTDFYITDERLTPVYDLVEREDKVLVFHAGTGPAANRYVGVRHFEKWLERYPDIRTQVAHLGCFEYAEFFALLDDHPNLVLDSAMILVDHDLFPSRFTLPHDALLEHEDQLLFGSDFPNIPYPYEESFKHLFSLGFPRKFYEKFMCENARRFYGLA
ncbi:MAG: amidohydrolase family protein [Promethearchaeota archaeon]